MVMAIHFSFAFPYASECCVTYLCSCLGSEVCKYKKKGLYLQFNSGDVQKAKSTANQLWQGLGKQPLLQQLVKSEVMENIPGPGPREGSLPGSWCYSALQFVQSLSEL